MQKFYQQNLGIYEYLNAKVLEEKVEKILNQY